MKAVIFALAIAAVASTTPLNAQVVLGGRPATPSTSRGTSVNGSWQVVGQDRYGTIYERRTYDANGNIVVQRARRDVNGNFSILSTRTVRNNNNRDCQLAGTNGTVGDIILGRSGTTDCRYDRSDRRAVDGVWRQVGQGSNNNSVYERRTYDAYGNVVVQKARRNPDGTFRILSTRTVHGNQGVKNRDRDDDEDRDFDRRHGDDDDDDRFDRRRDNDDDHRFTGSEQHGRGRGKGHKGRD